MRNPQYKGEWRPRRIRNPAYKGDWHPPLIRNPALDADADRAAYQLRLRHVGIDVWQADAGTLYDNIFVGDSAAEFDGFLYGTFRRQRRTEQPAAVQREDQEAQLRTFDARRAQGLPFDAADEAQAERARLRDEREERNRALRVRAEERKRQAEAEKAAQKSWTALLHTPTLQEMYDARTAYTLDEQERKRLPPGDNDDEWYLERF